jgi:hypothetical protein
MTITETDRTRIVGAMARVLCADNCMPNCQCELWKGFAIEANRVLDAALTAGLAEAIREQALREAQKAAAGVIFDFRTNREDNDLRSVKACLDTAIEALIGKPAPAHKGDEQ